MQIVKEYLDPFLLVFQKFTSDLFFLCFEYRWELRFYFLHACETFRSIALAKESLTPFNPNLSVSRSLDKLVIADRYRENETLFSTDYMFFLQERRKNRKVYQKAQFME